MYTAHSRGWITAQQRGGVPGGLGCSHSVDTLQWAFLTLTHRQLHPCSLGLNHLYPAPSEQTAAQFHQAQHFSARHLGGTILCAELSHVLQDIWHLRTCLLNANRTPKSQVTSKKMLPTLPLQAWDWKKLDEDFWDTGDVLFLDLVPVTRVYFTL